MPDYEFIGKAQLSRGFSFPLKRSTLDAFLDEHELPIVTGVAYCEHSEHQRVFSAVYHGPRRRAEEHTLTLWIYAVPSSLRRHVASRIEDKWLAALASWIAGFENQSELVSQTNHRFDLHYTDMNDDGTCSLESRVDALR